jgi:hypothetical protein
VSRTDPSSSLPSSLLSLSQHVYMCACILLAGIRHLQVVSARPLRCAECGAPIAQPAHVFNVPGAEGAVSAYVNPAGFVHQTVTLREARNVRLHPAPPCTADSW